MINSAFFDSTSGKGTINPTPVNINGPTGPIDDEVKWTNTPPTFGKTYRTVDQYVSDIYDILERSRRND